MESRPLIFLLDLAVKAASIIFWFLVFSVLFREVGHLFT